MTDEQIVEAAKFAEKKTEFGELVYSKDSRGVNSAYGIGFLEGAEWAREQMMKEAVDGEVDFEYFGYKVIRPDLKQLDTLLESMNHGDKVRIIIVKKD